MIVIADTVAPTTTAGLFDLLMSLDFTPVDGIGGAYAFQSAYAYIVVNDGDIEVYAYGHPPAQIFRWSAKFTDTTPLTAVEAAVRAAVDGPWV